MAVEKLVTAQYPATPPDDAEQDLKEIVLDLNLSEDILAAGEYGPGSLQLNVNRLPDLFEDTAKEPKTSFHVELLRNEPLHNVSKTIDGLNLTIERKLGG